MSADKEQEYFADGISEELLNLLAQVPELRVIARTSSFSFKGKEVDIAEIARRLNVANVLEGSVRKSGDTLANHRAADPRLRQLAPVVADLRPADDRRVQGAGRDRGGRGRRLKIKLLGAAPKARVTDPQAYALFLQARDDRPPVHAEAYGQSIDLFKQALALDPSYTAAWLGLGHVYFAQMDLGLLTADDGATTGLEAVNKALARPELRAGACQARPH